MILALNIFTFLAIGCCLLVAYFRGRRFRKGLSSFKIPFLVTLGLGTSLFMYGYYTGPWYETNYIALFVRSLISSLEMFVSETHLDEIVLENEPRFLESTGGRIYLSLFFVVYPAALIISVMAIASLVSRWLEARLWLRRHDSFQHPQFIFWGFNSHSVSIAKSLMLGGGNNGPRVNPDDIIFVEMPEKKEYERFSFKKLLTLFEAPDNKLYDELDRFSSDKRPPILLARKTNLSSSKKSLDELLSDAGLAQLSSRFRDSHTEVFLLNDDENLNLQTLNAFLNVGDISPTFYCHAGKESLICHFDDAVVSRKVHFVDSSYLAVRELLSSERGTYHPARFADVATDGNGNRLGYINGEFNAAIVGFGEVGQEALRFLYEFGSFPDKEGNLASSRFHVFDGQMDRIRPAFIEKYPGASYDTPDRPGRIAFYPADSDSPEFYGFLHNQIDSLNYVVVSTGNDDRNLSIAFDILDFAYRNRSHGLDRFIVLARVAQSMSQKALARDVYRSYCELPGEGEHLGVFGQDESIWKYDIISDKWINTEARLFYEAYQEASDRDAYDRYGNHCWDLRVRKCSEFSGNSWSNKRLLDIQEEQDRHNCFHAVTKRIMGSDGLYGKQHLIPPQYGDGKNGHYMSSNTPEDKLAEATFEYLAIGEHLRWVSSHEMSGYTAPPEGKGRDYLKKWHECMVPYNALPEEIKHYDWIPVKIAFARKP